MSGLIRPATPGFVITLAATIILAVVSFSVPIIKSVYFLKASLAVEGVNGDITFGTLGYCLTTGTSITCSNATVGYQLNVNALVGDTTSVQIPQVLVKWLTYVLVLHIVAFGLAAIAAIFGLLAHVREMAMSCFSSCVSGFAAAVALVAFIFDIALFLVAKNRINSVQGGSASIGNAVWLTLIAWVLLFFSGCFYSVGRCCIRRRSRDAWGGKVGTPIGENGYNSEQMRLDAVKAEADRKARQAQPEVGLPAFHEYDQSQPLKARVDGDEVYLEEDVPYRDNVSAAGSSGMGTYGRSAGRAYAGGGYMQAPPGTRAVDEYSSAASYSPRPQRRASNITHTTATTTPSIYPPSSTTAVPPSAPTQAVYDTSPADQYIHDPYSPQAYGHNPGGASYNPHVQTSQSPYDSYGAFDSNTYNATAALAANSSQSPYGVPYNAPRSTHQPDRGYTAYGVMNSPTAPVNDPYNDPYYGHYQVPSNPTPSMPRPPLAIDTQFAGAPTNTSPVGGLKNSIVMAPPPVQYTDSPPTYEPSAPGQWRNEG